MIAVHLSNCHFRCKAIFSALNKQQTKFNLENAWDLFNNCPPPPRFCKRRAPGPRFLPKNNGEKSVKSVKIKNPPPPLVLRLIKAGRVELKECNFKKIRVEKEFKNNYFHCYKLHFNFFWTLIISLLKVDYSKSSKT